MADKITLWSKESINAVKAYLLILVPDLVDPADCKALQSPYQHHAPVIEVVINNIQIHNTTEMVQSGNPVTGDGPRTLTGRCHPPEANGRLFKTLFLNYDSF